MFFRLPLPLVSFVSMNYSHIFFQLLPHLPVCSNLVALFLIGSAKVQLFSFLPNIITLFFRFFLFFSFNFLIFPTIQYDFFSNYFFSSFIFFVYISSFGRYYISFIYYYFFIIIIQNRFYMP